MTLAHYGGAPEAVTIVLPVVLFTVFMLFERRARRREREAAERDDGPQSSGPTR
jgi:preprotein translocase subunit YajC